MKSLNYDIIYEIKSKNSDLKRQHIESINYDILRHLLNEKFKTWHIYSRKFDLKVIIITEKVKIMTYCVDIFTWKVNYDIKKLKLSWNSGVKGQNDDN